MKNGRTGAAGVGGGGIRREEKSDALIQTRPRQRRKKGKVEENKEQAGGMDYEEKIRGPKHRV